MKRWAALLAGTVFPGCGEPEIPMGTPTDDAAGKQFMAPSAGKAALYVVGSRLVTIAPILVGRTNVGSLINQTWMRVDLAPGHYDVWVIGPHNTAFRSVDVEAGSTRFIEVTITNGTPINYLLHELPDGVGRAAVFAGKRAQEITVGRSVLDWRAQNHAPSRSAVKRATGWSWVIM